MQQRCCINPATPKPFDASFQSDAEKPATHLVGLARLMRVADCCRHDEAHVSFFTSSLHRPHACDKEEVYFVCTR